MSCKNCEITPGKIVRVQSIKNPVCIKCGKLISEKFNKKTPVKFKIGDATYENDRLISINTSEGQKQGYLKSVVELNDRYLISILEVKTSRLRTYEKWKKGEPNVEKGV